LGANEGPQFETHVPTENAGTITIKTDETTPLGGGGTSFHPVNLCMAGFGGSFAANFARWAALENIEIFGLSIKMNQKIDLTTGFGIEPHIPMIDDYNVELNVVSRESHHKLQEILTRCKERDFCYNCLTTSTVPEVILHHYQEF
jgi:uncharacterized OsmC-like protein